MALPTSLKLFIDTTNGIAYSSFSGSQQVSQPSFYVGDKAQIEIYLIKETGVSNYPRQEVITGGSVSLKVAVGQIDETPSAGTWALSYGGDTTTALAYNITTANLQTALNQLASITAAGGVTVSKVGDNYNITFNTNGARTDLTSNSSGLIPLSVAGIASLQTGDSTHPQIYLVHLQRTVAAYSESFTQVDESTITVTTLAAWDGLRASYRVYINPDPKGGTFSLGFDPLTGSSISTSVIPVGASGIDVKNALNTGVLEGKVTVQQVGGYAYDITVDTQPGTLGLTADDAGLLSFNGYKGEINLNTASALALLDGAEKLDTFLEVEITSDGKPLTVLQIRCILKSPVVDEAAVEPLVLDTYLSQTAADSRYLRISNNLSEGTAATMRSNLDVYSETQTDNLLALKVSAQDLTDGLDTKLSLTGGSMAEGNNGISFLWTAGNAASNFNPLGVSGQTLDDSGFFQLSTQSLRMIGAGPTYPEVQVTSAGVKFNDNTEQTTAFLGSVNWGNVAGTLADQTDLQAALDAKLDVSTASSTYYPSSNPSGFVTVTGDRYLTQSTSSLTVDNSAGKSLTVGTGLSFSSQQDCVISLNSDPANVHMHCTVVSYNSGTGAMVVNANSHTGNGTHTGWTVNVGGVTPQQSVSWGSVTGTLTSQTDLQAALDDKLADAPIDGSSYARKDGAWEAITSGGGMTSGGQLIINDGDIYTVTNADNNKHYMVTSNTGRAEVRFSNTLDIGLSVAFTGYGTAINLIPTGSAELLRYNSYVFMPQGGTARLFKITGNHYSLDATYLINTPPTAGTILFDGCANVGGQDAAGTFWEGYYVYRHQVADGIGGVINTDTPNSSGCYYPNGYVISRTNTVGYITELYLPDGSTVDPSFGYSYAIDTIANGSGSTGTSYSYISPAYGTLIYNWSGYTYMGWINVNYYYNGSGGYYSEYV